ncbi:MAG: HD family phosphohydrolase [Lachnospiraceae bacterium]|nr:HD family phosphohydrolase [Lachnospiraceae bacterium]
MKLSREEERELREYLKEYLDHPRVRRMDDFSQHGNITTYAHCYRVAVYSYKLVKRFKMNVDLPVLLGGAMLHDLFLYDWHTIGRMNPYHATNHAELACRNAIRYFNINEHTRRVIRSHMWPINITKLPRSKEAAILCCTDKWVSLVETLTCRKNMVKHGKKR